MKVFRSFLAVAALAAMLGTPAAYGQNRMQTYQVRGKVTKVSNSSKQVTIESAQIRGHEGMTMTLPYFTNDAAKLARFHEGDSVTARVAVTNNQPRIVAIMPTGTSSKTPDNAIIPGVSNNAPPSNLGANVPDTVGGDTLKGKVHRDRQFDRMMDTTRRHRDTTGRGISPGSANAPPSNLGAEVADTVGGNPPDTLKHRGYGRGNRMAGMADGRMRYRFEGRISSIDPASKQITITPDSIIGHPTGVTTLTYTAKDASDFESFHQGDTVAGVMIMRDNAPYVAFARKGHMSDMKDWRKDRGKYDSTSR